MSSQHFVFVFQKDQSQRLDKFLVERLPEYSRSRLQALIDAGEVTVDGELPHKSGIALSNGSRVEVEIPAPQESELTPEPLPLEVLFENQDVIVVNKSAGMVVHPSAGHQSGTLVHALLAHAPDIKGVGGKKRPGIVHRLDKDTSGVLIVAKNDRAHHVLAAQFKERQVGKVYLALVDGKPPTPKGRVEAPIGRDPANRQRMAVVSRRRGREAISEYFTLEEFSSHTLLEVHILTGRTHQIRLHMAFLECPVAGDTTYGRRRPSISLGRQFLHAHQLSIVLPGEDSPRTFEAPLPADLESVLEDLR